MAIVLAIAVAGCGSGHPSSTAQFDGAAYPSGVRAPDFALTDQDGHTVSLSGQRGRVVALSFVSSRGCRSCVLVAQQVRGALDELGPEAKNVETIFVSARPGADTRSSAARFLADASLTGRAVFAIDPPQALASVRRAYRVTGAEDAASVLLIDRSGLQRVVFGLEQLTPEALAHDIRALLSG